MGKKGHKNSTTADANDLWNNPMAKAAMNALSDEDILRYKAIGEQLYGNIDFEAAKVLNNMPPPMAEAVAYVSMGLTSGLHPSDLTEDELALMVDTYGVKWYEMWDYTEESSKKIE